MELNVNFRVLKVNNHRIQNSVCQDEKPGRGKVCPNEEPKGLHGQGKSVFNAGVYWPGAMLHGFEGKGIRAKLTILRFRILALIASLPLVGCIAPIPMGPFDGAAA